MIINQYTSGTVAEAVALYADLVAYWEFEENNGSATFTDAHGSNDLTIRTAGSTTASSAVTTTGVVANGFALTATADRTAYVPRANTTLDLPDSDWTFGAWIRYSNLSIGSTRFLLGRFGDGSGLAAGFAIDSSDDKPRFAVSSNGTSFAASAVLADGGAEEWEFVACTLDRTNDEIVVRRKSLHVSATNQKVTTAFAGALYTAGNANFSFNDALASDTSFFAGNRHNEAAAGRIDQAFYCQRAITDDEFDYLYNAGAGRSYAAFVADAT